MSFKVYRGLLKDKQPLADGEFFLALDPGAESLSIGLGSGAELHITSAVSLAKFYSDLIGSAPTTLSTFEGLSNAIDNDPLFSKHIKESILLLATKQDLTKKTNQDDFVAFSQTVNQALSLKANKDFVDSALLEKADASTTTAGLASKLNGSDFDYKYSTSYKVYDAGALGSTSLAPCKLYNDDGFLSSRFIIHFVSVVSSCSSYFELPKIDDVDLNATIKIVIQGKANCSFTLQKNSTDASGIAVLNNSLVSAASTLYVTKISPTQWNVVSV